MKLLALALLVAAASAARLENAYLPPSGARTSGGSGSFLRTPFGGRPASPSSFGGPSSQPSFGAPSSQPSFGAPAPASFGGPAFTGRPSAPAGGAPPAPAAPAPAYGAPASARFQGQGPSGRNFAILRFNNENNGDGSYRFEYETENHISQQESGEQRNPGTDQASSLVQGTYSYAGDDGATYTVNYVADENGFQPQGAHLPTPPPIPAEILRSLEINAAEEASGRRYDDSGYPEGGRGQFGGAGRAGFNPQTGYNY